MLTSKFVKDSVKTKMRYEIFTAEFNGSPLTEEEIQVMGIKEALDMIESHYNVTQLLQLLIELDGMAADTEEETALEIALKTWNTARLHPEKFMQKKLMQNA